MIEAYRFAPRPTTPPDDTYGEQVCSGCREPATGSLSLDGEGEDEVELHLVLPSGMNARLCVVKPEEGKASFFVEDFLVTVRRDGACYRHRLQRRRVVLSREDAAALRAWAGRLLSVSARCVCCTRTRPLKVVAVGWATGQRWCADCLTLEEARVEAAMARLFPHLCPTCCAPRDGHPEDGHPGPSGGSLSTTEGARVLVQVRARGAGAWSDYATCRPASPALADALTAARAAGLDAQVVPSGEPDYRGLCAAVGISIGEHAGPREALAALAYALLDERRRTIAATTRAGLAGVLAGESEGEVGHLLDAEHAERAAIDAAEARVLAWVRGGGR